MKLKKETIILVIVIVALALYLGLRRSDRTHYQLPQPADLTPEKISRIEVQRKDQSMELTRKDDKWTIGPKAYLADDQKVNNMLDALEKLKLTALVSDSGNRVRYDLSDDKKITIKAWEGKELKREFDIGKTANTFQHTFIKLAGKKSVYHANGDFRKTFGGDLDQFRDKKVLSFDKNTIKEAIIQSEKGSMTVTKAEIEPPSTETRDETPDKEAPEKDKKTMWLAADGTNVENTVMDGLLSTLSELKGERYIEDRKKEDFTKPVFMVRLKGDREYVLSIFGKTEKEAEEYPAVSSENDYPLMLSKWDADKVLKVPTEILKKAEKSEAGEPKI